MCTVKQEMSSDVAFFRISLETPLHRRS